ncbi:MAG: hypothetical protein EHM12_13235 [Dehalococcoidia bacterium]|nr:MAG: hypothetical protein EHM12_13235 [Dehalococcoidia bacterium]
MNIFLAIFTYFSYIFIIAMYTIKAVKYLRLPTHLRWELYPVMHEKQYQYGGSYFEHVDWQTRIRQKHFVKSILFFSKEYVFFGSYLRWKKSYWVVLYICHIGFIMLIVFQIFCFVSSIVAVYGVEISPRSHNIAGKIFYYFVLLSGVICFMSGTIGNIGLFIKRMADENLKAYASPDMYFGYTFNLILFLFGLYVWYYVDPAFSGYMGFWRGLITLKPVTVEPALAVFIIILALHLIYLPFTRAFHYISRIFAFFLILWDDEPNVRGSKLEHNLQALLNQKVSWSAPHIKAGKTWGEQAEEP